MRFDLVDLRLFVSVVEAGSITHGAAGANMTLPSASARLRGMEEAIGAPLLDRGRRGVAPTRAGQALLHHARLVLDQVDRMRGELGEFSRGLKVRIRMLTNTAAISEHLPRALAPFLAGRPNVDLELRERQSSDIVRAIAAGQADIGVASGAVDHLDLETVPFTTDRLGIVAPRGHPVASRKSIPFREVAELELVGYSDGVALNDYLADRAAEIGRSLSFRIRLWSFDGVCRMAEHGVGFGIVPEVAARRCRRSMAIGWIPMSDPWATRPLVICMRSLADLSPHARDLVAHLAEAGDAARAAMSSRS